MFATQTETRGLTLPLIQIAHLMRERQRLAGNDADAESATLEVIQAFAQADAAVNDALECCAPLLQENEEPEMESELIIS